MVTQKYIGIIIGMLLLLTITTVSQAQKAGLTITLNPTINSTTIINNNTYSGGSPALTGGSPFLYNDTESIFFNVTKGNIQYLAKGSAIAANKWCQANASGTGINCSSDLPAGLAEVDPFWTANITACSATQKLYFSGTSLTCSGDIDTDTWAGNFTNYYTKAQGNATYILKSGDTMTGDLNMSFHSIVDIANLTIDGYLEIIESLRPSTPQANHTYLFVESINDYPVLSMIDENGKVLKIPGILPVKNVRGTTIPANRFVYVTGVDGNVTTINLAKADNISTMPAIGITIYSILNGTYGLVMAYGLLENIDTQDGFEVGDDLYVSDTVAGMARNTVPITPNLTQNVGRLLIEDNVVGAIQVITGPVTGNEYGTIQNSFYIGNGTAGDKRLYFNDGSGSYLDANSNTSMAGFCIGIDTETNTSLKNWVVGQGYFTVESDPQVTTLTANKWCVANSTGTGINCTEATPTGGSDTWAGNFTSYYNISQGNETYLKYSEWVNCTGGQFVDALGSCASPQGSGNVSGAGNIGNFAIWEASGYIGENATSYYTSGQVDTLDTGTNNSIVAWATAMNTSMKGYCDGITTAANSSMKGYVDGKETAINNSATQYCSQLDTATNTTMAAFVTGTNVSVAAYALGVSSAANTSATEFCSSLDTATNTSMKNYADGIVLAANNSMKAYADGINSSMRAFVIGTNISVAAYAAGVSTAANTSATQYCSQLDTATNVSMSTYIGLVNTSMKNYVDGKDTAFNTSMSTYVGQVNTSMKAYVDGVVSAANTSMKAYADGINTSMKSYVDGRITTENTTMAAYVNGKVFADAQVNDAITINGAVYVNTTAGMQTTDIYVGGATGWRIYVNGTGYLIAQDV